MENMEKFLPSEANYEILKTELGMRGVSTDCANRLAGRTRNERGEYRLRKLIGRQN